MQGRRDLHILTYNIHNSPELGYNYYLDFIKKLRDFPGGAVFKNPPANAGDMG